MPRIARRSAVQQRLPRHIGFIPDGNRRWATGRGLAREAGYVHGQRSHQVSRIDLIVRWGGGRRLSGFLPAQSVYADFFVIDDYWPDFEPVYLDKALKWFAQQDRTLGG